MLILKEEIYTSLYGELKVWRDKTHTLSTPKKEGILPFVKGLRFSSKILYVINDLLEGSRLKAAWGHIVDEDNQYNIYSRECDIIIYDENINGWKVRNWNGKRQDRVMDFYFISKKAAVGVISCKSKMDSTDKKYPGLLKDFTNKVWLFAECCGHDKEKSIRKQAMQYGYVDFWSLYSWDSKKSSIPNMQSWERFEKAMHKLANKYPRSPRSR